MICITIISILLYIKLYSSYIRNNINIAKDEHQLYRCENTSATNIYGLINDYKDLHEDLYKDLH